MKLMLFYAVRLYYPAVIHFAFIPISLYFISNPTLRNVDTVIAQACASVNKLPMLTVYMGQVFNFLNFGHDSLFWSLLMAFVKQMIELWRML